MSSCHIFPNPFGWKKQKRINHHRVIHDLLTSKISRRLWLGSFDDEEKIGDTNRHVVEEQCRNCLRAIIIEWGKMNISTVSKATENMLDDILKCRKGYISRYSPSHSVRTRIGIAEMCILEVLNNTYNPSNTIVDNEDTRLSDVQLPIKSQKQFPQTITKRRMKKTVRYIDDV
jgi:hypothetical protein